MMNRDNFSQIHINNIVNLGLLANTHNSLSIAIDREESNKVLSCSFQAYTEELRTLINAVRDLDTISGIDTNIVLAIFYGMTGVQVGDLSFLDEALYSDYYKLGRKFDSEIVDLDILKEDNQEISDDEFNNEIASQIHVILNRESKKIFSTRNISTLTIELTTFLSLGYYNFFR